MGGVRSRPAGIERESGERIRRHHEAKSVLNRRRPDSRPRTKRGTECWAPTRSNIAASDQDSSAGLALGPWALRSPGDGNSRLFLGPCATLDPGLRLTSNHVSAIRCTGRTHATRRSSSKQSPTSPEYLEVS